MKTYELYEENKCCGCGACVVTCPKKAITMKNNQYGFIYPEIDEITCIDCGACKNICAFTKENSHITSDCLVCVNKDYEQIMNSASGGVFSAIASSFIASGGFVCGATSKFENGIIKVEHVVINTLSELKKLQGSKYVQSNTVNAFKEIKKLLNKGEKVLFSGTPCQVDAIKSMCKKYIGLSLYTVDIICHGVPSQMFFNEYLKEYQKRCKSNLTYLDFRNKRFGWGLTGISKFENNVEKLMTPNTSSYYKYFLDGEIYRPNCYSCPYANQDRVGDITIGDYWGVENLSPEIVKSMDISVHNGVSCVIINTVIGHKILDIYGKNLKKHPVEIEKVMIINTQLREPAKHTQKRVWILQTFSKKGYGSIEKSFQRDLLFTKIKKKIKQIFPKPLKNMVKNVYIKNKNK